MNLATERARMHLCQRNMRRKCRTSCISCTPLACRTDFHDQAGKRYSALTSALAVASFLAASGSAEAVGSSAQPSYEQLLAKLDRMEARIRSLESELHHKTETDAINSSKVRLAKTNHSKAARGQQETANTAELAAGQQTAALESPAPGD